MDKESVLDKGWSVDRILTRAHNTVKRANNYLWWLLNDYPDLSPEVRARAEECYHSLIKVSDTLFVLDSIEEAKDHEVLGESQ